MGFRAKRTLKICEYNHRYRCIVCPHCWPLAGIFTQNHPQSRTNLAAHAQFEALLLPRKAAVVTDAAQDHADEFVDHGGTSYSFSISNNERLAESARV